MTNTGTCERSHSFGYALIHNGFNDSSFAYCESCGRTAMLSHWRMPEGINLDYGIIDPAIEDFLMPCECGGRFRAGASPRCPECNQPLSSENSTSFIERDAPGTAKGWKWQRSWKGLYAMIVNGRKVDDPWNLVKFQA